MKRHLVIATAAAAALLAGGAVTAVAVNGSGSGTRAPAAALTAVPGKVSGLDLDRDRPGLVWDADVLGDEGRWHRVTLDAHTARVLNQRIDHGDDDHARKHAALVGARTDAAGAARKAAAGYGTVTSVDLDDDHRTKAVWEVETITEDGTEHRLLLDPRTGALSVAPAADAHGDHDDHEGGDD
ncbi:PepSY domain-containing protein [Streptomyces sp. BHT-5-2]|uniref:PepSY domain-containing protein n=1 Tax=Streptomyces sp. BHT-5-2 TaxID=2866715 RepID=UPI001C8F0F85|nr:PepSY domain-containing protein [Streptomyces sp. BHT-5-2]QZL05212.1 PepSY domain-containing protein [Streptomyces sp. BHT-5-2]